MVKFTKPPSIRYFTATKAGQAVNPNPLIEDGLIRLGWAVHEMKYSNGFWNALINDRWNVETGNDAGPFGRPSAHAALELYATWSASTA